MNFNELHTELVNWNFDQKDKKYDTFFIFRKVLQLDELKDVGIASSRDIILQTDRFVFTYKNDEVLIINETYPFVQGWRILTHINAIAKMVLTHFKINYTT